MLFRSFLILLFGGISAAFAQSGAFTCVGAAVPPIVNAEGITERVGDITINCSGGTPNLTITTNITLFLSVNITNRITAGNTVPDVTFTYNNGQPATMAISPVLASQSSLVFNGAQFTLSPTGTVSLIFSGVRGNAEQLGAPASSTTPIPIEAFFAFNGGTMTPINVPQFVVAYLQTGLYIGGTSSLTCTQQGSPLPSDLTTFGAFIAAGTAFSSTRVTEGFGDAFVPLSAIESQGAQTGTRILVQYTGVPPTASLYAPDLVAGSDAMHPTAAGDLGGTVSGGTYVVGSHSLLLARVPGADSTGTGGTPVYTLTGSTGAPTLGTVSAVPINNGSAYLTYEVVDANQAVQESAQFPTFLGIPGSGSGQSFTTQEAVSLAPLSTFMMASSTAPIPRFILSTPPPDCGIVGDCGASYYGTLVIYGSPVKFTAVAGGPTQAGYFEIQNQGGGLLEWSASITYTNGSGWLSLSPSSGHNNGTVRLTVTPGSLAPGTYSATVPVNAGTMAGTQNVPVTLVITPAASAPAPTTPDISSVVNAASFAQGPLAPGSLATILGVRFTGTNVVVNFDGVPGTLLFSNASQLNVQVPASLAGQSTASVVVVVDGDQSAAMPVALSPFAPAIFTGGILNQDSSVNNASAPAQPGSVIQIFATGLSGTGKITARIQDRVISSPYYAGPAPGITGVQQVNLFVPSDLGVSTASVVVCGNASSNAAQQVCSAASNIAIAQ